jgi:hypothetical protein
MTTADHRRGRILGFLRLAGLLALAAVAVLWFWNVSAEAFGWPPLRFRNAAAFVLAAFALVLAGRAALATGRRPS